MLQAMGSDYVRTARAKGLAERIVVLKHAMRNALDPGGDAGRAGARHAAVGRRADRAGVLDPGFGKLIVDSVFNRDYAVVQGVTLVTATTYILLEPAGRHRLRADQPAAQELGMAVSEALGRRAHRGKPGRARLAAPACKRKSAVLGLVIIVAVRC